MRRAPSLPLSLSSQLRLPQRELIKPDLFAELFRKTEEIKRQAELLRASEEQFRALAQTAHDAVISADCMAHGHGGVAKHISDSYRDLHGICGIGPTVGFTATGEAARAAEGALMQAHHEKRELSEREVISLKKALENLRVAAASELTLMYQRGG